MTMNPISCEANAPYPIPSLSLVSTTFKKSQPPICDTFGPFLDETICSGLDRVLFYLGARRIQRLLCLPTPTDDCCLTDGECSVTVEHIPCPDEHKSFRSCNTTITETKCSTSPVQKITVTKNCCCPKCKSSASRTTSSTSKPSICSYPKSYPQSTKVVKIFDKPGLQKMCENAAKKDMSGKTSVAMRRSFSMCSLACRKIKQKLFMQNSKCACRPPMWLWTRMLSHPDGSEVYEIFKSSDPCTHPTHLDKLISKRPQKIFVALPNGTTVPFQTVNAH